MSAICIRRCRGDELRELEWTAELAAQRPLFTRVFEMTARGAMEMLVALDGDQHVGQIWVALEREPALLWALRVKPGWQRRWIGTRLIAVAERIAYDAGSRWAEIEVEPGNARARALYERLGYRFVRRHVAVDVITGAALDLELDTLRRRLAAPGR